MENIIKVETLFLFLKKYCILILLTGIIGASIGYFYSKNCIQPVYEVSTDLLVNQKTDSDQQRYVDVQSNQQLINTYMAIIKSNKILNEVIQKLHLKITSQQLKSQIKVDNQNNSQVLTLSVRGDSIERASKIASTAVKEFQDNIATFMGKRNISVLSEASSAGNFAPISPKIKTNSIVGLFIGILLGIAISIFLFKMNTTIKSTKDIETNIDLPIIGSIPKERK